MAEKGGKLVLYYGVDRQHFIADDGCEVLLEESNILGNEELAEYQEDTLEKARGGFKEFRTKHLIYMRKALIEGVLGNKGKIDFKCYVCNTNYKITRKMYEAKFGKIDS